MKKLFVLTAIALFGIQSMTSQGIATAENATKEMKYGIFNHVSIGAGVSILDGITFEAAAPITPYLQLRLGYSFLPNISYTAEGIEYTHSGTEDETDVKFQLNSGNAKALIDILPFRKSSFHITAGAYIGKEHFIKAHNTEALQGVNTGEGLHIGDYMIGVDNDGMARAAIKVKKFKPYVGIGFGRAVPKKRVSCTFDMGVMFWGSPEVVAMGEKFDMSTGTSIWGWQKVTKDDTGDYDSSKVFDIISKVTVCPVITLRINGRIF